MSEFWSWYVIIIVAINIIGCWALLHFTKRMKGSEAENETTGHVYDGIEEYNKPLPKWWLNMFYITLIFGVVYLILYPGLGNYKGLLEWTPQKQHAEEVAKAEEIYKPLFAKYAATPIPELVKNKEAVAMGRRIFVNNCAICHGSDGRGNPGFPNLADNDWLYGGSPEQIVASITNGRQGAMPAFGPMLSAEQLDGLVHYVGVLSGQQSADPEKAKIGEQIFKTQCFACHGMDGKGNTALGAPNLTDNVWLYGSAYWDIAKTIREGRNGQMPAHKDLLGDERIHLVATYVYSLSQSK